jgi:hypothetical protein
MSRIPLEVKDMAVVRVSNEDPVANKKTVRRHMDGATAQEQLLDAAESLFYRDGIRAISVDAVVERAGVNKMSVYRRSCRALSTLSNVRRTRIIAAVHS